MKERSVYSINQRRRLEAETRHEREERLQQLSVFAHARPIMHSILLVYLYCTSDRPPPGGPALRANVAGQITRASTLVNAEHYGRAGANPPSLTVRDYVYTCRLVPCFFPQLNCHHGHVTVPVDYYCTYTIMHIWCLMK